MELSTDVLKHGDKADAVRAVIRQCFGEVYNPDQRYIICIQGATSSGKSVFSRKIHSMLSENGINSYLLPLDSYYFQPMTSNLDEESYDFENPAALDWDNIFEVMKAIRDRRPYIYHNVYPNSFSENVKVTKIPNTMPNVLIVEGVQAFNTVSDKIFNIKEFDPYNSDKVIEKEFIDKGFDVGDFKVLKILMTNCASKILSITLKRDEMRGRTREAIVKRCHTKMLPGTLKWVYSPVYSGFIKIVHGNFNAKKVKLVVDELSIYFLGERKDASDVMDMNLLEEFMVECSGECKYGGEASVTLSDRDI